MKIQILDENTIQEVQEAFNRFYPFLRIEFFNKPQVKNELNSNSGLISANKKVGAVRKIQQSGYLSVDPERTVLEIEEELKHKFGLNAQIFRKSGSLWIETSLTDAWSLKLQNDEGREITNKYKHSASTSNHENHDLIEFG